MGDGALLSTVEGPTAIMVETLMQIICRARSGVGAELENRRGRS
jgi:hypothetical protein